MAQGALTCYTYMFMYVFYDKYLIGASMWEQNNLLHEYNYFFHGGLCQVKI